MLKFINKQITNMTKNWEENRVLSEVSHSQDKTVGISEPIVSFIETFKSNHRRFKLETIASNWGVEYTLTDKLTKEVFNMYLTMSYYNSRYVGPSWMTEKEVDFVQNEIHTFYISRKIRLGKLQSERIRKRLMVVYCK